MILRVMNNILNIVNYWYKGIQCAWNSSTWLLFSESCSALFSLVPKSWNSPWQIVPSGASREMKFNVSNFARSSPNLIKTPGTSRPTLRTAPRPPRRLASLFHPACGINGAADFANSVMNSAPYYAQRIHAPIHPSPSRILPRPLPSPPLRKTPAGYDGGYEQVRH